MSCLDEKSQYETLTKNENAVHEAPALAETLLDSLEHVYELASFCSAAPLEQLDKDALCVLYNYIKQLRRP